MRKFGTSRARVSLLRFTPADGVRIPAPRCWAIMLGHVIVAVVLVIFWRLRRSHRQGTLDQQSNTRIQKTADVRIPVRSGVNLHQRGREGAIRYKSMRDALHLVREVGNPGVLKSVATFVITPVHQRRNPSVSRDEANQRRTGKSFFSFERDGAAERIILELRDTTTAKLTSLGQPIASGMNDWQITTISDALRKVFDSHKDTTQPRRVRRI